MEKIQILYWELYWDTVVGTVFSVSLYFDMVWHFKIKYTAKLLFDLETDLAFAIRYRFLIHAHISTVLPVTSVPAKRQPESVRFTINGGNCCSKSPVASVIDIPNTWNLSL